MNLYPELKIPRTTAQYWISRSKELDAIIPQEVGEVESAEKCSLQSLKLEIEIYRSLLARIIGSYDFSSLKGVENKKFAVELVSSLKGSMPKSGLIKRLGMSASKFYRWESEVLGCRLQRENC